MFLLLTKKKSYKLENLSQASLSSLFQDFGVREGGYTRDWCSNCAGSLQLPNIILEHQGLPVKNTLAQITFSSVMMKESFHYIDFRCITKFEQTCGQVKKGFYKQDLRHINFKTLYNPYQIYKVVGQRFCQCQSLPKYFCFIFRDNFRSLPHKGVHQGTCISSLSVVKRCWLTTQPRQCL